MQHSVLRYITDNAFGAAHRGARATSQGNLSQHHVSSLDFRGLSLLSGMMHTDTFACMMESKRQSHHAPQ